VYIVMLASVFPKPISVIEYNITNEEDESRLG